MPQIDVFKMSLYLCLPSAYIASSILSICVYVCVYVNKPKIVHVTPLLLFFYIKEWAPYIYIIPYILYCGYRLCKQVFHTLYGLCVYPIPILCEV